MTDIDFCRQVLRAVRKAAEDNDVHVERAAGDVEILLDAVARAALAIAQAADPEVQGVIASFDSDDQKVKVNVIKDGGLLEVEPGRKRT
jgi:hypothetical protein